MARRISFFSLPATYNLLEIPGAAQTLSSGFATGINSDQAAHYPGRWPGGSGVATHLLWIGSSFHAGHLWWG